MFNFLKLIFSKNNNSFDESMNLLKESFDVLEFIGEGKDGKIYTCISKEDKNKYICKILSIYGIRFLPIVKEFISKNIEHKNFYKIKLIKDKILYYKYDKLTPISTNGDKFLNYLVQICNLEKNLIDNGLVYWDFGFDKHCNYMTDNENNIKIIDYGGNSFLLLEKNNIKIKKARSNLVFFNNDFFKLQLLSHLYYYGLGRQTKELVPSIAQGASLKVLNKYTKYLANSMRGTIFNNLIDIILEGNFSEKNIWSKLEKEISEIDFSSITQEAADINEILINDDNIIVDGYQKYQIKNNKLYPQRKKSNPLWDTYKKFEIVDKAFKKLFNNKDVHNFLDIGSNLGLYVFLAKLNYNIPNCFGVDYNKDYISACNNITKSLDLSGVNFEIKNFSELEKKYDCVLAMGMIHHLFHRTESFGSLDKILQHFNLISNKYVILEFPTEKDNKASKWTNMPGRNKEDEYSLDNFLKYSKKYFSKVVEIGRMGNTRITYILEK